MYVVIVEVKLDPDRMTEIRQFLNDVIAPRAQEFAGFESGRWLRSSDGDAGRSLLFFESENAARAAANEIQTHGVPEGMPVVMEDVETFEVLVQA
jgi:uncharacterized protein YdiU (UPF0061 family)